jgi:hypothetical protein
MIEGLPHIGVVGQDIDEGIASYLTESGKIPVSQR